MADNTTVVRAESTVGVSPKAVLATVYPLIGTILLAIADGVADIDISPTWKVIIVGVVNVLLALLGAVTGDPGNVRVVPFPHETTPGLPHKPEEVK
jgi:hypothetical protein